MKRVISIVLVLLSFSYAIALAETIDVNGNKVNLDLFGHSEYHELTYDKKTACYELTLTRPVTEKSYGAYYEDSLFFAFPVLRITKSAEAIDSWVSCLSMEFIYNNNNQIIDSIIVTVDDTKYEYRVDHYNIVDDTIVFEIGMGTKGWEMIQKIAKSKQLAQISFHGQDIISEHLFNWNQINIIREMVSNCVYTSLTESILDDNDVKYFIDVNGM